MKKIITLFIICLILIQSLCISFSVAAAGATLGFSKSTLRAGDKFTVTLNVSLSKAITVDGKFSYSENLTLNSISASVGTLDRNGKNIFIDLGSNAISGTREVAIASFTVKSSAAAGETVSVSFSGNQSNTKDTPISASSSKTVAPPLSSNCNLKSLTVKNASLTAAFNSAKTSYTAAEVDFSVSKLDINAVPEDPKAKVTVFQNSLSVGNNAVKISVKAETGATKIYTISVKRKQDPNYKPSSNTALSNITVNGFIISPPFSNGTDNYVVWLPYETTSITASAVATDTKATVTVSGGRDLTEGDNEIVITCTAEDGTQKNYYIIAKRAFADDTDINEATSTEKTDSDSVEKLSDNKLDILKGFIIFIISFVLGAFLMLFILKFSGKRRG